MTIATTAAKPAVLEAKVLRPTMVPRTKSIKAGVLKTQILKATSLQQRIPKTAIVRSPIRKKNTHHLAAKQESESAVTVAAI